MSQRFTEGALTFFFPDDWCVCRPQATSFYRRHFQSFCGGCGEVDFAAYDPGRTVWLVEVKDYRAHARTKPMELADELAGKVRDVLALLPCAGVRDNAPLGPQIQAGGFWRKAKQAKNLRVVLHCELPAQESRLFAGVKDAANLQAKLRQKLRCVDPHARLVSQAHTAGLPWQVQ